MNIQRSERIHSRALAIAIASWLVIAVSSGGVLAGDAIAIRAGKVYTGDRVLENAVVLVENGKVIGVGPSVSVPDGATVHEHPDASITPGLIDAYSTAGVANRFSWAEHSSEVIPHLRNLDAWNMQSRDFDRLIETGVTTIGLATDPSSVIGARNGVVKTARSLGGRVLRDAVAPMVAITAETWTRGESNRQPFGLAQPYVTRRPTTGMGNSWVLREAFYTAIRNERGRERDPNPGPAHDHLIAAVDGETPIWALARRRHDIYSAMRMLGEVGIERFVLVEGTQAYRIADDLAAANIPVIFGPHFERPRAQWRIRSGEATEPNLASASILEAAGVTLALTAVDRFADEALAEQATMAIRHGLSRKAALNATTATPAALLGVSDRVGSIAPGKDADLVIWSGEPFDSGSAILKVLVDGHVVHESEPGS